MPKETIEAFQDHGEILGITLEEGVDEANRLLRELRGVGVDYDDVTRVLEEEGVQKFIDSFEELIDGIRAKRGQLVSA
jgi:transaldolase